MLLTATLGATWIVIMTLVGGAMFPGYSHASQFISELGARGAPFAEIVNYFGFLPAGLLLCVFAFLAWRLLPRSVGTSFGMFGMGLFAFGYIAATFFPCEAGCRPTEITLSQALHNFLGLAGYFTAPFCLATLGVQARKWPRAGHLSILAFASAVGAFIGLAFLSPEFEYVGLAQRLLEASTLAWIVACSVYVYRESRLNI